jgi:hypothetical protein
MSIGGVIQESCSLVYNERGRQISMIPQSPTETASCADKRKIIGANWWHGRKMLPWLQRASAEKFPGHIPFRLCEMV